MRRRKFLATTGVAASGIVNAQVAGAAKEKPKRIITKSSEAKVDKDGFNAIVEVVNEKVTKSQPAEISLTIENQTQSKAEFEFTANNMANTIKGVANTGNNKAILVGTANTWEPSDSGWVAPELDKSREDVDITFTLKPGDEYYLHYHLWSAPAENGNLPPKSYEFTREYGLTMSKRRQEQITLSLGLEVENP